MEGMVLSKSEMAALLSKHPGSIYTALGMEITQCILRVMGERCCSPDNSLKKPAVHHKGNDDFMQAQILGKTYPFPH
jgi:hypothetical protein